jgi:hypothetical protein
MAAITCDIWAYCIGIYFVMVSLFTYAGGTQVIDKTPRVVRFHSFCTNIFLVYWFRNYLCLFPLILTSKNTVEPGYNDMGLRYISSIASDIVWYQLIPRC